MFITYYNHYSPRNSFVSAEEWYCAESRRFHGDSVQWYSRPIPTVQQPRETVEEPAQTDGSTDLPDGCRDAKTNHSEVQIADKRFFSVFYINFLF